MTREEKLDKVLSHLVKNNLEYKEVHYFYFEEDEIQQEIEILLEQIVQDGFATYKEIDKPDVHPGHGLKSHLFRITTEGLRFNETSSYKQRFKQTQKKRIWSIVEKISIVTNGVLLLFIAVGGLYVSDKANEDRVVNKQLKHQIDSLYEVIKHKTTDTVIRIDKTRTPFNH